jgi:hypothetical protein
MTTLSSCLLEEKSEVVVFGPQYLIRRWLPKRSARHIPTLSVGAPPQCYDEAGHNLDALKHADFMGIYNMARSTRTRISSLTSPDISNLVIRSGLQF